MLCLLTITLIDTFIPDVISTFLVVYITIERTKYFFLCPLALVFWGGGVVGSERSPVGHPRKKEARNI